MKNYFIHILALAVLCEVCHAYTEMVLNEMDTDFKLAVKTYYKIMRAHCHSGPTSESQLIKRLQKANWSEEAFESPQYSVGTVSGQTE
jgi:hypothetical protein